MDHATLSALRDRHPAWRLLASPHAPLVASFLHQVYVAPNVRVMSEGPLCTGVSRPSSPRVPRASPPHHCWLPLPRSESTTATCRSRTGG